MAGLDELKTPPRFHLAIPVDDLSAAEAFYGDVLGCPLGRRDAQWIDFNFFGLQLTTHLVAGATGGDAANDVDGHEIPVRHFGLVLDWDDWHRAVDHLTYVGVPFTVHPHVRFEGGPGEQATFFLADPAGNQLEFKAFRDPARLFATD